jgi:small subunit ribosomal protein S6
MGTLPRPALASPTSPELMRLSQSQRQSQRKEDEWPDMNKYELALVVSPELDEENLAQMVNKVTQWITDGPGQVIKVDNWGKRRLAYSIRKFRDGIYLFVNAEMETKGVADLERNLNIAEPVLRHLVVRLED